MHAPRVLLPLTLLALALGARAAVADGGAGATAASAWGIGDRIERFSGKGLDGETVGLADLEITPAKARAAVATVARGYGAPADAPPATALRTLSGVRDEDGEVDEDKVLELAAKAGQVFGVLITPEMAEGLQTLGDVTAWIEAASDSPIVVSVWSPRCPMCKNFYDERVNRILAEAGVRYLAIAGNYPDQVEEHIKPYLEGHDYHWKVIVDPDQVVVDRLGGRKTPHLFVIDTDLVLRYAGTVDDDPRGEKPEEERENYLLDAIRAVRSGAEVEVTTTEPAG